MNFIPRGSEHWTDDQRNLFEKQYPDPSGEFSFDGDYDCNDGDGNCSWDGMSSRCNCGNRRVYWEFDGDWVYPEVN